MYNIFEYIYIIFDVIILFKFNNFYTPISQFVFQSTWFLTTLSMPRYMLLFRCHHMKRVEWQFSEVPIYPYGARSLSCVVAFSKVPLVIQPVRALAQRSTLN